MLGSGGGGITSLVFFPFLLPLLPPLLPFLLFELLLLLLSEDLEDFDDFDFLDDLSNTKMYYTKRTITSTYIFTYLCLVLSLAFVFQEQQLR